MVCSSCVMTSGFNLASIAVVLPPDTRRFAATFVHPGFVDEPDGFRVILRSDENGAVQLAKAW
ncbi:MAG: hypothetical protein WKF77_13570 [Planctomycetaceae bacterium]